MQHQPLLCLGCHLSLRSSNGVNTSDRPSPGAIALCWECGHLQQFGDPPDHYVPIDDAVMLEIAGLPVIVLSAKLRGVYFEREKMLAAKTLTAFEDRNFARRIANIVRKMKIAIEKE